MIDGMHQRRTSPTFTQPSYLAYWGKARPTNDGPDLHLLVYHCLDVAAVGRTYLQRAPALLSWLGEQLGFADKELLCDWVTFWLALHDLGKFSISFQAQRADLVERLQHEAPLNAGLPSVRHDSLGMQLWRDHIEPRAEAEAWFGDDIDVFDGIQCWAQAVTGHHGQPPLSQVTHLGTHFRPRDVDAAQAFTDAMRELLLPAGSAALPTCMDAEAFERISRELSWWIAGLAVLADWVGSNAESFKYCDSPPVSLADYWHTSLAVAEVALSNSGVLPASRQDPRSFAELFPSIREPSPLQSWAASVEIQPGPQIHLLEDVTGAGKTEAAVTLTHRLMASGCADGFFIGLPTMATANAMYGRIANVYDLLFADRTSLVLAHGRKTLVEDFAASVIAPGQDEGDARQLDESATRRCARWLADHNKRALLASAGVGTVDQALLGALQSKHQSLRLLGLMRKVLVIDEVHACDAYMQRTLEVLLEFHAHAGGSAVLLSATLTQRMKSALLKAFAKGCERRVPSLVATGYPLATSWRAAQPDGVAETAIATRPDVRRTVKVHFETDQAKVVAGIAEALAAGQCVAWIRNTVGDALEARALLAAHVPAEHITLFHARFTLGDRLDLEGSVLRHFGRDSGPEQRRGRLLIATQVAEQSLDIDLDLVVSDLAPIDRLIQRAGRLRRHVRDACGQRLSEPDAIDQRGEPCLWVYGPHWADTPNATWFKKSFPKASGVYPHHGQLWLTAKALQGGQFTMPDDARALIETVFGDEGDLPDGLQGNANQAEGKAYGDASMADLNSVKLVNGYVRKGMEWAADTVAPSRLGEETIDVLIGRWEGDQLKPWCADKPPQHAWAYSTVRVAKRLIAEALPESSPARQAALQAQLDGLPGGGKWVVLLAFENRGGQYVAPAQAMVREGKPPRVEQWTYDADSGLRAEIKTTKEEA
jgi:CRISPR-associated endonuclease/helicase Cas3